MSTPISPAVLACAAELLAWRTDTAAERQRMAEDLALLLEIRQITASMDLEAEQCWN